ncbi:hypothetical protein evm_009795 [Chilo suppressalis]|nr:hypothetical protein evm_009795 [Chilo suppressalis]
MEKNKRRSISYNSTIAGFGCLNSPITHPEIPFFKLPEILERSHTLDERFLYSQTEVRRVQWHPTSFSHLLVLVSDNTIRLYNVAMKTGPKLVKIFTIGPKPSGLLAGKTILDSLGDTGVDFTPTPDAEHLVILKGNGDVYMMECNLEGKSGHQPKLSGPLAMYPPADDNYGTESCSITALGGAGGDTPPLLVVATCSAALYHCLLLPTGVDKEDGDTHALYVVEAVELNITLGPDDEHMQYSYPVHLYPCTGNTYACVHAGGVHTVTLPILAHLKDYTLADEADADTALSSLCSQPSTARHIVCTSTTGRVDPPAGVVISPAPLAKVLVLCPDSTLLPRTIEPYDLEEQLYKELQLKNPALEQDDIDKLLKERQKLSFSSIVQEILSREVSQPILNLNKEQPPALNHMLQFLTQATLRFRGEYMSRQQRATDALLTKLRAQNALKVQHKQWLQDLQQDVEEVQIQSTALKEKCMLAEKHQDDFKYRCSTVVRELRGSCGVSAAERELSDQLSRYQQLALQLQRQITRLQHHATHQRNQMKEWQEEYKKKDIALGKSHSDTISSILQQQTSQISTLIEDTKLLKDQLSIV